jgi:hypothetical protein
LAALRIKLIHRQTILDGIREVERGGEIQPEDRKDFIRRLFAVAISVGFAGSLVHMPWIDQPDKWFDSDQTLELVRLATGIFVMVSGWEWYHRDLKDRPLKYPLRFYLDVAIVIYTIVFLYSSTKEGVWLFSLVVIFIGYCFGIYCR